MTEHESPALTRLRDRVRTATEKRTPLRIRAGGTKDFYGNATTGEPLDPREFRGIVDYAPTELVVTVRAGTPLAELEASLAEHNQMLPFEPPHFGETPPSVVRCRRHRRPAPRGGRPRTRFRAGRAHDRRPRRRAVLWRARDEERRRLRHGARAGGFARHARRPGRRVAQGAAARGGRTHVALRDRRGHAPYASSTSGADSRCRSRPVPGWMARCGCDCPARARRSTQRRRGLAAVVVDGAERWWIDLREQRHPFFRPALSPRCGGWRCRRPRRHSDLAPR